MKNFKSFVPKLALSLTVSAVFVYLLSLTSCGGDNSQDNIDTTLPLNISIVLDLSDRLTRDNVSPTQTYNDTALINYFIDYFTKYSQDQKANQCNDKFQILFYPSPSEANIVNLSRNLCVDLSKTPNKEKRKVIMEMKSKIDETLDVIYSKTLEDKKWEGSDIWDFFTNKKVDDLCIKPGYRNIVAILTDGYLYHANHKLQEDNAYSYVLPQTLQKGGTLLAKRNDLSNLEVIMLEVNPYTPNQRDQLVNVLNQWFLAMGLSQDKISINETDVENRTETVIDNFLNK